MTDDVVPQPYGAGLYVPVTGSTKGRRVYCSDFETYLKVTEFMNHHPDAWKYGSKAILNFALGGK